MKIFRFSVNHPYLQTLYNRNEILQNMDFKLDLKISKAGKIKELV